MRKISCRNNKEGSLGILHNGKIYNGYFQNSILIVCSLLADMKMYKHNSKHNFT